jgi:hypothetical protein
MGVLYARDPTGFLATAQGQGQTHLFFQSDQGLGSTTNGGGEYQITPIHRTVITGDIPIAGPTVLTFGTPAPSGLLFKPLLSEEDGATPLVSVDFYSPTNVFLGKVRNGVGITLNANDLTLADPVSIDPGLATAAFAVITYVHASHV